jgi:hypothetical protein
MKKIVLASAILALLVSCKKEKEAEITSKEPQVEYTTFGDTITPDGGLTYQEMTSKFGDLVVGDTIDIKFTSTIKEVCQKKGCWMNVALDNDKETFIKFKDYDFFVPMNAQNKEVVVGGKAYVSVESVADLKHYAKDAGKSQAAIDSIKEPKVTYAFMADGVLIKK